MAKLWLCAASTITGKQSKTSLTRSRTLGKTSRELEINGKRVDMHDRTDEAATGSFTNTKQHHSSSHDCSNAWQVTAATSKPTSSSTVCDCATYTNIQSPSSLFTCIRWYWILNKIWPHQLLSISGSNKLMGESQALDDGSHAASEVGLISVTFEH